MGFIWKPVYTLEPTMILNSWCGRVTGDSVGDGYWIPEIDFMKMGFGEKFYQYYLGKGIFDNITNIKNSWVYEKFNCSTNTK